VDNTTPYKRGKIVTKAVLKVGIAHSKGTLKRAFGKKKAQANEEIHEQSAKAIFEALGQLKGVSVKIAQQIALGMPFLPQSYLDELGKSFNAIPPINRALVRKIIKQELGGYPEEVFENFESLAFGSASLGQVHRATIEGEAVALKIQYPAIASTIATDMKVISYGFKHFANGQNIDHLIQEINDRLYEEVDYEHEAKNIHYFRENLVHEKIIIPKVYEHFSSKKVLALSFVNGLDLDKFLATSSTQELKNHYAQLIFETFFSSLYTLKAIHADPNPANFIFMEDSKLGIIDFGCVKRVDEDFLDNFNTLHLGLIDKLDDMSIIKEYIKVGMIDESDEESMLAFYRNVIKPLDSLYVEILQGDSYDFGSNCDFSKRGFKTIMEVQQLNSHSVSKLNQDYLFTDRTLLGYYAIFEKLEAIIDTRKVKTMMRGYKKDDKI